MIQDTGYTIQDIKYTIQDTGYTMQDTGAVHAYAYVYVLYVTYAPAICVICATHRYMCMYMCVHM
jgi:hypothetical protein